MRRRGGLEESGSPKLSRRTKHRSNKEKIQPIIPWWIVISAVIFFLGVGYLQNHYRESRSRDPFGVYQKKSGSTSSSTPTKKSLLSPEEDLGLERDPKTGLRYHLIFSTDCSPYQHWQSYLVYFTAMKVRQPGHITRVASGCEGEDAKAMQKWFDEDVQYLSSRFHLMMTPHFSGVKDDNGDIVGEYKFFNKPFGTKYFMEHSPHLRWDESTGFPKDVHDEVIILIDPDMGLLRPITADFSDDRETIISPNRRQNLITTRVAQGKPAAQVFGFGTQWARLDLEKIAGVGTPAAAVTQEQGRLFYPVGPPYLATVQDMHHISSKWSEFVPRVYEQYPNLLAEMFAYCIAAAHLELPHQLVDSLMVSDVGVGGEGWPLVNKIPPAEVCEFGRKIDHSKYAVPSVLHMCQRYILGQEWLFAKRRIPPDIYDCETPLFQEPPATLALDYDYKWGPGGDKTPLTPEASAQNAFMLCSLYGLVNEAATFHKKNRCPPATVNLQRTRNLVEYIKFHGKPH